MIEINLLPEALRVKKKRVLTLPNLPLIPIGIGIAVFLIIIHLILITGIQVKKMVFSSLNGKFSSLSDSSFSAEALEVKLKDVSSKVGIVENILNSRFHMAKKLNDLSDSVVSGIWLKDIEVKKEEVPFEKRDVKESLAIEGSSIISGAGADGFIGKFVNSLKENASFSADFDEIELSSVERAKIKGTEIMNFVIICHFKKGKGL